MVWGIYQKVLVWLEQTLRPILITSSQLWEKGEELKFKVCQYNICLAFSQDSYIWIEIELEILSSHTKTFW